jgi:GntR family transcriptional regulator, transcriptional repressor for pyruvate dehydrogenase complex
MNPTSLGIERIPQKDLQSEITSQLARLIAKSAPGTRLPSERELGESLAVGRNSIREAVRSLAFIGALEVKQGDGIYVTDGQNADIGRLFGLGLIVQRPHIHEIIEARRLIELNVVTMAAERYTETDRERLRTNLDTLSRHLDDPDEASRLDLEFHVLLAQTSHNSVFAYFVNGMRALIKSWIDLKIANAANYHLVTDEILQDHQEILEAILAHDAALAADAMSRHLAKAAERLEAISSPQDNSSEDFFALLIPKSKR